MYQTVNEKKRRKKKVEKMIIIYIQSIQSAQVTRFRIKVLNNSLTIYT